MVEKKQKGLWSYDTHPEDCDCNTLEVEGHRGQSSKNPQPVGRKTRQLEWEESEYTDVEIKKCPDCGFLHDTRVGDGDEKDDDEEIEELLQEAEEELEDSEGPATGQDTLDKIAEEYELG